jgi:hypothetical protein
MIVRRSQKTVNFPFNKTHFLFLFWAAPEAEMLSSTTRDFLLQDRAFTASPRYAFALLRFAAQNFGVRCGLSVQSLPRIASLKNQGIQTNRNEHLQHWNMCLRYLLPDFG